MGVGEVSYQYGCYCSPDAEKEEGGRQVGNQYRCYFIPDAEKGVWFEN